MQNNPFAGVFRQAFEQDILKTAILLPAKKVEYAPRVHHFMSALNAFLRQCGERPILYQHYCFNEVKLREYALFLRGYMRDAQKVLASLEQKYAIDNDLISLFGAAGKYVVASNRQLTDKRVFDDNVGYRFWYMDLHRGLSEAVYQPVAENLNPRRNNLFLFMPFRLKDNEQILSKWMFKNMRQTLDNKDIFADDANGTKAYVVHFPIEKSRCSNITSLLKTLRYSENYFESQDMDFVRQNWLPFLAECIEFQDENKIKKVIPYTPVELMQNLRHITIFSYCAGTANAHRCLNALHYLGTQIYGEKTMRQAMQNVFVCSYGYLPLQPHSLYSGVHFYTHALQDEMRREPFVNLNNHALYEQTKNKSTVMPAQISVMPDGRNYVVALTLADKLLYTDASGLQELRDAEFGHNMTNVNTPNLLNRDNYAHRLFKSVIENSCKGLRGKNVLKLNEPVETAKVLQNAVIWSQRRQISS